MSEREFAKSLIDRVPENRLFYVIAYLQGAAVPDEVPNDETLEAMQETKDKIKNGTCQPFYGSTAEFFDMLLSED